MWEPEFARTYTDGRLYFYPRQDGAKGWMTLQAPAIRRRLKAQGLRVKPREEEAVSEVDEALIEIEDNGWVDYAGPLAGYQCGLVRESSNGKSILVTSEPNILQPSPGEWDTLRQFFEGLLLDKGEGIDQRPHFYGWLKVSYENLVAFMAGEALYRPAACLAFCGPRDCGKTLLLEILRSIFGRSERAYLWLSGASEFNSELAGAELLTVDDDAGLVDVKSRRVMTNKIKAVIFGGDAKIHAKGREAISLRPWWRISFALNDEPEDLRVLPLIDDSMADKISLFRCMNSPVPMPNATRLERWQQIQAELPAFLNFLVNEYQVPAELYEERTGSKTFQHPVLVDALSALDPAAKLLSLVDEGMESRLPGVFTASEVERILTERDAATSYEARKLLQYPTTCGTYLSRLATSNPSRVSISGQHGGAQRYFINQPQREGEGGAI